MKSVIDLLKEDENIATDFKNALYKKLTAEFTCWDGTKKFYEINENDIDNIVSAVKGQYTFSGDGITIIGASFSKVDIYGNN